MNTLFFREKIERDKLINSQLIAYLFDQFDVLSGTIKESVSRLLNAHHIWNARLKGVEPESLLNDALPARYWIQLNDANFSETLDLINDLPAITVTADSHDQQAHGLKLEIIYQLLLDSYHFRKQIAYFCKLENKDIPLLHLIDLD